MQVPSLRSNTVSEQEVKKGTFFNSNFPIRRFLLKFTQFINVLKLKCQFILGQSNGIYNVL